MEPSFMPDLLAQCRKDFQVAIQEGIAPAELEEALAVWVNRLLKEDFSRLIQLLYRVDIPESKIKTMLLEHPGEDAGMLIARLMIARQAEKITSRNLYRMPPADIPEEERW